MSDLKAGQVKDEKLSPCPFCEGTEVFVQRADFACAFVRCNDCSGAGPTGNQSSNEEEPPGAGEAIAAWNRRAAGPAAGAEGVVTARIREERGAKSTKLFCEALLNSVLMDACHVELRRAAPPAAMVDRIPVPHGSTYQEGAVRGTDFPTLTITFPEGDFESRDAMMAMIQQMARTTSDRS